MEKQALFVKLIDNQGIVQEKTGYAIEGIGIFDDETNDVSLWIGGIDKDGMIYCCVVDENNNMQNREGIGFHCKVATKHRGHVGFMVIDEERYNDALKRKLIRDFEVFKLHEIEFQFQLEAFLYYVTKVIGLGLAFHPDTPFEEYGILSKAEWLYLDAQLQLCDDYCDTNDVDIYDVTGEIVRDLEIELGIGVDKDEK